MHEIKFRAWDKESKMMLQMGMIGLRPCRWIYDGGMDELFENMKEDVVLMQFTGLKDKNGIEIYEGDIVEERYNNGKSERWTVKIFDAPLSVSIASGVTKDIIGNIYENPEFLNAQDAGNNAAHS